MHRVVPAILVAMFVIAVASAQQRPVIEVYKSKTCGCCGKWVEHLKQHGFSVRTTDVENVSDIKEKYKVPSKLGSCHTGLVDGYVIEGHVPATDVLRLLQERPKVVGIAVPGMPMGSPGMEGPRAEAYEVVSFDQKNDVRVFSSHRP
jgi:hypothetical protein